MKNTRIGAIYALLLTITAFGGLQAQEKAKEKSNISFIPGKGMTIVSDDDRYKLSTRIRTQFLYDLSISDAENVDNSQNFQNRRSRLAFEGNTFEKDIKFKMELAVSPRDQGYQDRGNGRTVGQTPLLDWYVTFEQIRDLNLRIGQYKIPFSRQRVISSGNQQFVDRSSANGEFNMDRDMGLDLRSKNLFGLNHKLKYYLGVYTGEGRDSSNRTSNGDFGMHYLGRLEVNPFGKFSDYSEVDLGRSKKPGFSIGVSASYIQDTRRDQGVLGNSLAVDGVDTTSIEADFIFKMAGFSAQAEFFNRTMTKVAAPRDGMGWMGQVGYLLPKIDLEFAARFSQIIKSDSGSALNDSNEFGPAISYYHRGSHAFKVQADFMRSELVDVKNGGQWVFRTQMQAGL